jgi:hypothetical protein
MYERTFGTDWTPGDLDVDDAVRRMYALGVAASLDREPETERDRLLALASTQYQRSMLDLSYEEGERRARATKRDPSAASEPEAVWETLLSLDGDDPTPGIGDAVRDSDLPSALAPAKLLTDRPGDDDLSRLDLPDALRRD